MERERAFFEAWLAGEAVIAKEEDGYITLILIDPAQLQSLLFLFFESHRRRRGREKDEGSTT